MIKFSFIARCHEETIPLEVSLEFKPGNQTQRARRMAVGELLAKLEAESASVDASGADRVKVDTPEGLWIIAESYGHRGARGKL